MTVGEHAKKAVHVRNIPIIEIRWVEIKGKVEHPFHGLYFAGVPFPNVLIKSNGSVEYVGHVGHTGGVPSADRFVEEIFVTSKSFVEEIVEIADIANTPAADWVAVCQGRVRCVWARAAGVVGNRLYQLGAVFKMLDLGVGTAIFLARSASIAVSEIASGLEAVATGLITRAVRHRLVHGPFSPKKSKATTCRSIARREKEAMSVVGAAG